MNELFNIKDNVTVITGGTGVLGRTIAKYLAKNGAKVIILGRKEDVGNKIVEDIKEEGYHAEFMKTDVMNQELVQKNCDDIIAKYGRIDTLLNAAGGNMPGAVIAPDKNFFDLKVEEFQKVLNLNLTGTVTNTDIPEAYGETRQGVDYQFLFNGSIPSYNTCMRLCSSQSWYK